MFPFMVLREPSWSELSRSLDQYEKEVSQLLLGLSKSLEVMYMSEFEFAFDKKQYVLSDSVQERIRILSEITTQDGAVLRELLLQPFPVMLQVSDEKEELDEFPSEDATDKEIPPTLPPPRFNTLHTTYSNHDKSSYDSASQVIAHMVRDWTVLGQKIRESTHSWCVSHLKLHCHPSGSSVLVPGAGLGRLAYDIYLEGYNVQANELSLSMAAASHAILVGNASGILHPFALDYLVNEIDEQQRYEKVSFPDVDTRSNNDENAAGGVLSYFIGDFVELYGNARSSSRYGAIVTCFFLDTATNLYEYVATIINLLENGGVWINVGPLQWHSNAILRPSAGELKFLLQSMGFEIKSWSIDTQPMDYRNDDEEIRSTKYEGFRALRFVATLAKTDNNKAKKQVTRAIQNMRIRQLNGAISTATGLENVSSNKAYPSKPQSTVRIEEIDGEQVD